jgi:hypothetical protein
MGAFTLLTVSLVMSVVVVAFADFSFFGRLDTVVEEAMERSRHWVGISGCPSAAESMCCPRTLRW